MTIPADFGISIYLVFIKWTTGYRKSSRNTTDLATGNGICSETTARVLQGIVVAEPENSDSIRNASQLMTILVVGKADRRSGQNRNRNAEERRR